MWIKKTIQSWFSADTPPPIDGLVLASINRAFEALPPQRRVEQALELLPENYVLTSSFGAQSAVMLHAGNTGGPDRYWISISRDVWLHR
jgi:3'-phosphoadenosine 5'-phosphosulfate sulfotransferase (PAPS reductase)/FAD synthetase